MNHGTFCKDKIVLKRRFLSYLASGFGAMSIAAQAMAQTVPIPPNTVNPADLPVPPHAPVWLSPSYYSLMRAPLPNLIYNPFGVPAVIPQNGSYPDSSGVLGSFQPAGATNTATNPFFQPLGTNGRGCITCHSPAAAMGLIPNP